MELHTFPNPARGWCFLNMREPVTLGGTYPKGGWSSFMSVVLIKYPNKNQLRGEEAYFSLQFQLQSLRQGRDYKLVTAHSESGAKRSERIQAYSLCAQLSFSILTHFGTPCLGNSATQSGPCLPISINLIKTILHSHAHRPGKCRQFLTGPFSPKDAGLCQADF